VGASLGVETYTPILAHLGHWYVSLPVFGAPVLIVAIVVWVRDRREGRRTRAGDTSHLRVVMTESDGRTILAVNGALDYPALLDVEHLLGEAVRRELPVLVDLSNVTSVEEEDFAWSVTEIINSVEGADIAVLLGSAPALRTLRNVSKLEGINLVGDAEAASGAPPA
jgi:hypothetical protein